MRRWYVLLFLPPILIAVDAMAKEYDIVTRWVHLGSSDLSEAIFRWRQEGGEVNADKREIYLFGNSATREAFDQKIMAEALGIPVYNFALTSVRLDQFDETSVPLGKDDVLVIGLNEPLLDDRTPRNQSLDTYNDDSTPYLVRHRSSLFKLLKDRVRYFAGRVLGHRYNPYRSGEMVYQYRFSARRKKNQNLDSLGPAMRERLVPDGRDHAISNVDAFVRLYEKLQESGCSIIVFVLPDRMPPEINALYSGGAERLIAAARERNIHVIDGRTLPLDDADYFDYGHLLSPGRNKVSDFAIRELRQVLGQEIR
ncbi:MAG: hypothetical protein HUU29_12250 [Planctomycetaceae bacterium]|nr:hypothetical protein [Planctomycetaceae bacterium]